MKAMLGLLVFVPLSKSALAFRLQSAWPTEREQAQTPPPLLVQRELWASGVEWTHYPRCLHTGLNYPVWRWTAGTAQMFKSWVDEVQYPPDCSRKLWQHRVGYVIKPHWGLTSRIRDYGDNVIMNMLRHKMTLYHALHYNTCECFSPGDQSFQRATSHALLTEEIWPPPWVNSTDPFMNCIFEPLSTCQGKINIGGQHVRDHYYDVYNFDRFRNLTNSWWSRLKETGLRQDSSHKGSDRMASLDDIDCGIAADSGAVRLGIFRTLLSASTFQPNARLRRQIETLERRLAKPNGPMLVVHVRRTDKYKEEGGKPFVTTDGQDLTTLRALIRSAEASAGWNYTSFYLISDDPTVFTGPRMELLRSAFAAWPVALFSPYVQQMYSQDNRWMTEGHLTLKDHTPNDIAMMADIFYAAKHGSHLVGCGRSGLSQLIAQKLGAKFMMDPNVLSLFEDDEALLTNLVGKERARSHLAFMNHLFPENLPADV